MASIYILILNTFWMDVFVSVFKYNFKSIFYKTDYIVGTLVHSIGTVPIFSIFFLFKFKMCRFHRASIVNRINIIYHFITIITWEKLYIEYLVFILTYLLFWYFSFPYDWQWFVY